MRKTILLFILLAGFIQASWAQEPLQWHYSVKKVTALKYRVYLSAKIDAPWHTYSQSTPHGGPLPTSINFTRNPLVTMDGLPKEVGQLHQIHDDVFDVDVKYFQDQVDFVEDVDLKADVKTNVAGTIRYMVCTDEQCLPPATVNFSLSVGGD